VDWRRDPGGGGLVRPKEKISLTRSFLDTPRVSGL